jgi:membrane associated rhomboid family serine protease
MGVNENSKPGISDGGDPFAPPRGDDFDSHRRGAGARPDNPPNEDLAFQTLRLALAMGKSTPLTWILAGLMLAFYAAMLAFEGFDRAFSGDSPFLAFSPETLHRWGAIFVDEVKRGQWGRLITGSWIFFGHVSAFFALLCFVSLGRFIERIYGKHLLVIFFVVLGVLSGVAEVFTSSRPAEMNSFGPVFGMVGVVFGFTFKRRALLSRAFVFGMRFQLVFWLALYTTLGILAYDSLPFGIAAGSIAGIILGLSVTPAALRKERRGSMMLNAMTAATLIAVVLGVAGISSYGAPGTYGIPGGYGRESGEFFREYKIPQNDPPEFFELTKKYANGDCAYTAGIPAAMKCEKLGKRAARFSAPGRLYMTIIAHDRTPHSSRELVLGLFVEEFMRVNGGLAPELLDKKSSVRIGENDFDFAEFRLSFPKGGGEIYKIFTAVSGEFVYEIRVQRHESDRNAETLAAGVLGSFRPFGKEDSPGR